MYGGRRGTSLSSKIRNDDFEEAKTDRSGMSQFPAQDNNYAFNANNNNYNYSNTSAAPPSVNRRGEFCKEHYNLLQNFIDQSYNLNSDIPLQAKTGFNGHKGKPLHFCWGHGLNLTNMVSCDDVGNIIHWSGRKGKKITVCSMGAPLVWIDIDQQSGRFGLAGSTNGNVYLVDLNSRNAGKIAKGSGNSFEIAAHQSVVTVCKFLSPTICVSGSKDKSIAVFNFEYQGQAMLRKQAHEGPITSLDVSEDDPNIMLTCSTDQTTKIWDIRVKNPVQHEFKKHYGAVYDVEFMPGMISSFGTAGDDGSIRLFDLRMSREFAIFIDQDNPSPINSITFSPSGRIVCAATDDRRLKAWDTFYDNNPFQYMDFGFGSGLQWAKLSKDGFTMGTLGKDGVLGIAY